jgi:membrane fusion protein (multidrug efflux system)
VQRVPVRVALDPAELAEHPLRIGLSMTAEVDVHETRGAVVATQVRAEAQPTRAGRGKDPAVEQRIAAIIAQNSGVRVPSTVKLRAARAPAGAQS